MGRYSNRQITRLAAQLLDWAIGEDAQRSRPTIGS
jgi:hypothetical protein